MGWRRVGKEGGRRKKHTKLVEARAELQGSMIPYIGSAKHVFYCYLVTSVNILLMHLVNIFSFGWTLDSLIRSFIIIRHLLRFYYLNLVNCKTTDSLYVREILLSDIVLLVSLLEWKYSLSCHIRLKIETSFDLF